MVVTMRGEWGGIQPVAGPDGTGTAGRARRVGRDHLARHGGAGAPVASVARRRSWRSTSSRACALLMGQRLIGAKIFEVGSVTKPRPVLDRRDVVAALLAAPRKTCSS